MFLVSSSNFCLVSNSVLRLHTQAYFPKSTKSWDNLTYIVDVVTSSGILKAKQKLGVTFNFDKQDVFDLKKFSKMTMCRASEANSEKQS